MGTSKTPNAYVGYYNDLNGGMTHFGKIIRDAWIFGLIPETETCQGWLPTGLHDLWDKTNKEWEKYDFLVSNLPPEMKERFMRIQAEAVESAKKSGWDPEEELSDDK